MYFSGCRDGFIEEGSTGWENESMVTKAEKDSGSSGELEPLCATQAMGNLSLCQAIFNVSGSSRRKNRGLQMEVHLTSHVAVRYMHVNTGCAAGVVHGLCPTKEAFMDTSGPEKWRDN